MGAFVSRYGRVIVVAAALLPVSGCGGKTLAITRPQHAIHVRCVHERIDARSILGMKLGAARTYADAAGCLVRVSNVDGRRLPVAQDSMTNRIDVATRSSVVVAIEGIG